MSMRSVPVECQEVGAADAGVPGVAIRAQWLETCWGAVRNPAGYQEWNMKFSRVLAYIALAAVAAGVILNAKDIKRYIQISTM